MAPTPPPLLSTRSKGRGRAIGEGCDVLVLRGKRQPLGKRRFDFAYYFGGGKQDDTFFFSGDEEWGGKGCMSPLASCDYP